MDRADFIHLVRVSEQASADDSDAYRRMVVRFAALGFPGEAQGVHRMTIHKMMKWFEGGDGRDSPNP